MRKRNERSIKNQGSRSVCKTGENEYKKHFIYLTDTVLYVVEDMSGSDVSPYHYEVTFYPQMFVDGVVDFEIGD